MTQRISAANRRQAGPGIRIGPVCRALVLIGLACAGWLPANVSAQYFGQNKVQYETFDFEILRTEHFDIYFYPREREGIALAARFAERWHARLSRLLAHELTGRQTLIMYASSSDFQQTNVLGGSIGEGTGGVTESLRRRIVLPFGGTLADTDHVIGHELVHAFQYDIANQRRIGNRRTAGIGALPLWFIEGMAEYLSIGARSPLTAMWMRDAVAREKLPAIRDLDDPRYFPYRWGHAFWAYVGGRWGDRMVGDLLVDAVDSGDLDRVFRAALGMTAEELSEAWHGALRETFQPIVSSRQEGSRYGRLLTPKAALGGELNVSPMLSPDGRRIAYLSERGLFSVDLYVADTQTGEIIRRLTRTAVDPHVESLQFISSAGAWDPSGRQIAVIEVRGGKPVLAIYDAGSGKRTRELPLADLDGALHPAWSPDGTRMALSGMAGGLTDLYLVELSSGTMTRLTNDAFADIQPAWSPDGTRLAFATERFGSSLATAQPGGFRIGVMDVASRDVRAVTAAASGKQIAPQWTGEHAAGGAADDGGMLYFIADPDGVSDIFRVRPDGTGLTRVTRLRTGASGITETSPALSVAGGRLAFSVFDGGAYRIYVADDVAALGGEAASGPAGVDAARLPPVTRQPRQVTTLLSDPSIGLPPSIDPSSAERYRPRLGLDFVGQPMLSVGADRFGTYGAGGVSFFMSDMLGDHNLLAAFQTTSSFDGGFSASDLGGAVVYQNLKHRWNWGVALDQTPYRTGFYSEGLATVDGRPALVQQALVSRQTDRGVTGLVAYPFNRAQRIEVSTAFRQLTFENRLHTTAFALDTGELLLDERQKDTAFPTLNLGQTSAALVYDTASFGATSPVLGQRYRLEASPMFGSLRYTGLLADYRRYFMPVRLYTIAARVLHYGRYGGDGEDPRLFPLFIGYPSMVRGYDVGSFRTDECPPTADNSCPTFDRLVGSRVLVGNLELRFPLLRPFGLRERVYGPIPVEVALFADGGFAWSKGERPELFGGDRKGVSSAGVAFRVNALGFAVVQLDVVRPFQRPGRGWLFQFSMSPGF